MLRTGTQIPHSQRHPIEARRRDAPRPASPATPGAAETQRRAGLGLINGWISETFNTVSAGLPSKGPGVSGCGPLRAPALPTPSPPGPPLGPRL